VALTLTSPRARLASQDELEGASASGPCEIEHRSGEELQRLGIDAHEVCDSRTPMSTQLVARRHFVRSSIRRWGDAYEENGFRLSKAAGDYQPGPMIGQQPRVLADFLGLDAKRISELEESGPWTDEHRGARGARLRGAPLVARRA